MPHRTVKCRYVFQEDARAEPDASPGGSPRECRKPRAVGQGGARYAPVASDLVDSLGEVLQAAQHVQGELPLLQVYAPGLVHQGLHVDAGRGTLQAHAAVDERVLLDLLRVGLRHEHLEECLGILDVQADGGQEHGDALVVHVLVELRPRDGPGLVVVHGLHEALQLQRVDPLLPALLYDHQVLVLPADPLCVLNEDAGENVDDRKVEEGDVKEEEQPHGGSSHLQ
mmetsp:Transcript_44630/g.97459  ORF Transcript_44630/g.97459 Transcript_44630/m.97459 type:complete len:226 (+) Transcript_44630:45-722(+)